MFRKCGYSNDQMQDSIERGHNLVLHVTFKGGPTAFLIHVPQKETTDAAE